MFTAAEESANLRSTVPQQGPSLSQVRTRLPAGGRWIRTSGTADDARLLADLYAHNASRQMPQKGSSDQTVACFRRLGARVVGSAAVCAFRFRPPGTGSKRAGWRRSGAFFGAVCLRRSFVALGQRWVPQA